MKVFFVYNPHTKKWEQQNYLERENITILVDNFILCPPHKEFEKIFHYGQLTADSPTMTKTCAITTNCYALPEILINKKALHPIKQDEMPINNSPRFHPYCKAKYLATQITLTQLIRLA